MGTTSRRQLLEECISVDAQLISNLSRTLYCAVQALNTFGDGNIYRQLLSEYGNYFHSVQNYKELSRFLFLFNGVINSNCFDTAQGEAQTYLLGYQDSFDYTMDKSLEASDLGLAYKFERGKKTYGKFDDKALEHLMNIAKGYDIRSIENFLVANEMYTYDYLRSGRIKELDTELQDQYFGVYDGGVVIPKVRDDKSAIIAIHYLVHNALFMNRDNIRNNKVVYSDEVPTFYEMLYKSNNGFIRCKTHESDVAKRLIRNYQNEPFMDIVKKVKKMI